MRSKDHVLDSVSSVGDSVKSKPSSWFIFTSTLFLTIVDSPKSPVTKLNSTVTELFYRYRLGQYLPQRSPFEPLEHVLT